MKRILVIVAIIIMVLIANKDTNIIIPNNAIRFRVIAASNTLEDQKNKNEVSIDFENYIYNLTKKAKSPIEVKEILNSNYSNINNHVSDYLKENNIKQNYNISIGNNYFPKKEYKGIKYDEGYYDSIVLTLGNGNGLNWWCVIYPPLCLIDENKEDVQYTTLAKEILNKYA